VAPRIVTSTFSKVVGQRVERLPRFKLAAIEIIECEALSVIGILDNDIKRVGAAVGRNVNGDVEVTAVQTSIRPLWGFCSSGRR
jgi:hypothetical protein